MLCVEVKEEVEVEVEGAHESKEKESQVRGKIRELRDYLSMRENWQLQSSQQTSGLWTQLRYRQRHLFEAGLSGE